MNINIDIVNFAHTYVTDRQVYKWAPKKTNQPINGRGRLFLFSVIFDWSFEETYLMYILYVYTIVKKISSGLFIHSFVYLSIYQDLDLKIIS